MGIHNPYNRYAQPVRSHDYVVEKYKKLDYVLGRQETGCDSGKGKDIYTADRYWTWIMIAMKSTHYPCSYY